MPTGKTSFTKTLVRLMFPVLVTFKVKFTTAPMEPEEISGVLTTTMFGFLAVTSFSLEANILSLRKLNPLLVTRFMSLPYLSPLNEATTSTSKCSLGLSTALNDWQRLVQ